MPKRKPEKTLEQELIKKINKELDKQEKQSYAPTEPEPTALDDRLTPSILIAPTTSLPMDPEVLEANRLAAHSERTPLQNHTIFVPPQMLLPSGERIDSDENLARIAESIFYKL